MTNEQLALLLLILLGGIGFIFIIAGILTHIITKKRNEKCASKATGFVVDHFHNGEVRMGPIVQFENENGMVYKTQQKFEGFVKILKDSVDERDIWEDEKHWLHAKRSGILKWRSLAQSYWPLNSEMTVYYDKNDPMKINYVERPITNIASTKKLIINGFVDIGIGIIFYLLLTLAL